MKVNLTLFAEFLRTLGEVAPLLGLPGTTRLFNAGALLFEQGEIALEKQRALVAEMKTRAEAGVETTPEEILADIERIKDLDRRIQESGRIRPGLLGGLLGCALAVALLAPAFSAAPAPRQAALSWGAVTQDTEGGTITGVTYSVYRGGRGTLPAAKTRIATSLATLAYVDSGRPAGVEDCYQVTASTAALGEGGPSGEGCKSYPAAPPAAPSLTVQ